MLGLANMIGTWDPCELALSVVNWWRMVAHIIQTCKFLIQVVKHFPHHIGS
jgi:hypothetical protein